MANQETQFVLCEGERIIRTFELTRLPRLLAPDAIGYLSITTQRVVYHSQAKSLGGESRVLSEMALDDVAGFSTTMSASFNWLILLVITAVLYFANLLVFSILPNFLTHWAVGLILILPFAILFLFEKRILSPEIQEQVLKNLHKLTDSTPLKNRGSAFFRPIFLVLFIIGVDLIFFNIVLQSRFSDEYPLLKWLLVLGFAVLLYRLGFGRYRVFSLQIMSKSAKGSGIFIQGNPFAKLLGGDRAAVQTLQAGPGSDADTVIHELGAMLTDIRLMGDLGIQKWEQARE
ncbi:MAG TPA: hypothetical protein PLO13_08345 [Anaerolineaceae bacterium]|jgi:hypothetical protein|nr:hypothetical protein [bacterium]HQJ33351.1 hypothetical protein [Anaerolineaceae bacterium]